MNIIKLTLAAATLSVSLAASASALPIGHLGAIDAGNLPVDQVRTVCNGYGRCWWVPGGYYRGYGWRGGYGYYGYRRGYYRGYRRW